MRSRAAAVADRECACAARDRKLEIMNGAAEPVVSLWKSLVNLYDCEFRCLESQFHEQAAEHAMRKARGSRARKAGGRDEERDGGDSDEWAP